MALPSTPSSLLSSLSTLFSLKLLVQAGLCGRALQEEGRESGNIGHFQLRRPGLRERGVPDREEQPVQNRLRSFRTGWRLAQVVWLRV